MRPERRKCGKNRNGSARVCLNACACSACCEVRPVHAYFAREKEFPHRAFELPTETMPGTSNKRIRYTLRAWVFAPSLVRSREHAAGVTKPGKIFCEAKGARAANRVLG